MWLAAFSPWRPVSARILINHSLYHQINKKEFPFVAMLCPEMFKMPCSGSNIYQIIAWHNHFLALKITRCIAVRYMYIRDLENRTSPSSTSKTDWSRTANINIYKRALAVPEMALWVFKKNIHIFSVLHNFDFIRFICDFEWLLKHKSIISFIIFFSLIIKCFLAVSHKLNMLVCHIRTNITLIFYAVIWRIRNVYLLLRFLYSAFYIIFFLFFAIFPFLTLHRFPFSF